MAAQLEITILTLFPEVFGPFLSSSLLGKAAQKGSVKFTLLQIRDFATDKHKTVDDSPYGGGAGMLLRADVLHRAWKAAGGDAEDARTILLSPQGPLFTQARAKQLATSHAKLILVCGHYEGVDERFIELCVNEELSIGDYVLTGGELPAMVVAEAVARLLPGTVGKVESVEKDSLEDGLLKYPQYTRPPEFEGLSIPEVLLSGNHAEIEKWREAQRHERTARKRPDLLKKS